MAKPDSTFLFPITDHAGQITTIMAATLDEIFLGKTEPAQALSKANQDVNELFQ
jgi:multiple sugar transport system substrate-binding protein